MPRPEDACKNSGEMRGRSILQHAGLGAGGLLCKATPYLTLFEQSGLLIVVGGFLGATKAFDGASLIARSEIHTIV